MSRTPVLLAMPEPSEPKLIIKRLFKVAEILTRMPISQRDNHVVGENGIENQDEHELGYLETKDRLMHT